MYKECSLKTELESKKRVPSVNQNSHGVPQKQKVHACTLSHFQLSETPWTVAHQAPLSMGVPRQEYWSGLPFPPPGNLPNSGIKPESPEAPVLAGRFLTLGQVDWIKLKEEPQFKMR